MSTKALLKYLFDRCTDLIEASHASMPSNTFEEVTLNQNEVTNAGSVENLGNFVAPCDGYIIATAYTRNPFSRLLILSSAKQYLFSATITQATIGGTIPISKGYTCTIQGQDVVEVRVLFYKTFGSLLSENGGGGAV